MYHYEKRYYNDKPLNHSSMQHVTYSTHETINDYHINQSSSYNIKSTIASIERELGVVNDERAFIENDMQARQTEDEKIITTIKMDNDELKAQLAAKDAEVQELRLQVEALTKQSDEASISMSKIDEDIVAMGKHSSELKADIPRLDSRLEQERLINRDMKIEIERVSIPVGSVEHGIQILEEQLMKNKKSEDDLLKICNEGQAELDDKIQGLRNLEDDIARMKTTIIEKENFIREHERQFSVQIDRNNSDKYQLDRVLAENNQGELKSKHLDSEYEILENDAAFLRADCEKIRASHTAVSTINKDFETELEALNKHAQLLETQNVDLTRELDNIVVLDRGIRADLDREHRVISLQAKNDHEMRRSIHILAYNRSPSPVAREQACKEVRFYSRSPVRRI